MNTWLRCWCKNNTNFEQDKGSSKVIIWSAGFDNNVSQSVYLHVFVFTGKPEKQILVHCAALYFGHFFTSVFEHTIAFNLKSHYFLDIFWDNLDIITT